MELFIFTAVKVDGGEKKVRYEAEMKLPLKTSGRMGIKYRRGAFLC